MRHGWPIVVVLLCAAAFSSAAEPPTFDAANPARPVVKIAISRELAEDWTKHGVDHFAAQSMLRVARLNDVSGRPGPALFGQYRVEGSSLCFQPDFELGVGRYQASLFLIGQPPATAVYEVQPTQQAPATVARVYPSADRLPANLLKFYIHFSRPVRQSDRVFDQIHILDDAGKPVYDPWRRFQQWSDDGARLTLWIHPGRIKHDVNLREDFGPVLKPGHAYTLRIDADVLDLAGRPLTAAFEKKFTAVDEVHARISLDDWKVQAPHAGTRDPLIVQFPSPLDAALLQRMIWLRDADHHALAGQIEVDADETRWTFRPQKAWLAGPIELQAAEALEDVAGNAPTHIFDAQSRPDSQPAKLTIAVQPLH